MVLPFNSKLKIDNLKRISSENFNNLMIVARFERDAIVARVEPTLDYDSLKDADIVIEAVFEDIKVKHQVVKETEAVS